jgi:hypothetical protein
MSGLILYRTEDGQAEISLRTLDGSVWLTQLEIAELFATTKQNTSLHIANILKEGELDAGSVVKDSLTTAADGKNYRTRLFSLPLILGRKVETKAADEEDLRELEAAEKYLERVSKGEKS